MEDEWLRGYDDVATRKLPMQKTCLNSNIADQLIRFVHSSGRSMFSVAVKLKFNRDGRRG